MQKNGVVINTSVVMAAAEGITCIHTLSSELLLSFTKSGNVVDSEVTDLLNAVAPVVNLCASPVLVLLPSWFVTSCIT